MKFPLGKGLKCDLSKLVDTRMLVQCNSGGGKSWCLRRILEQTHGHVQQLVIDPEGEFASLRERFDYVWAAKAGGDTAADPRSAKLLAERLLELGVSAILDIYELKAHERIRFVRGFLEAMVDAPKKLWHPALVVVDECHIYCPQKGEAESAGAVIDLCTRGRKRGYCAVLATQRLSKLHKDAAAELNNKLIGRTGLDVDIDRAADELGFTSKEQKRSLRELSPGEFFAFGPALAVGITKVIIAEVQTTHPEAGARIAFTPPPPTAKVKALLPQLADLPAEAEQKQRTEAELKKDLATARATITRLEHSTPARTIEKVKTVVEKVEVPVLTEALVRRLEAAAHKLDDVAGGVVQTVRELKIQVSARPGLAGVPVRPQVVLEPRRTRTETETARPVQTTAKPAIPRTGEAVELPKGELAVLRAVAHYPEGCSRKQLTVLTGYRRSTRDTYLQRLGERGLVQLQGGTALATEAGLTALGPDFEPLPIGSALLEHWRRRLPEGERKVLDLAVATYPESVQRDAISDATGYARSSRDTYLQRLGAKRLVEFIGRGAVKASDLLFDGASR